jgi:transcriptional regulator with XRE-family HTH domain
MAETSCYVMDVMTGRPPTKEATEFGKRIAEARRQRGLTQQQFADLLGVSRKMVDYYERRATNVTADVVKKLSAVLNVSADDLLGLESKRPKPGPKSKLQIQIEQIQRLPKGKQQTISEMLDMAVKSASS